MKLSIKRQVLTTVINTAVMAAFFLIKYIFLPEIPNIDLTSGSDLDFILTWIPIPLISIIGMIYEKHLRFWIVPDLVYCALSFAVSGENCPYDIGISGFFTASHYSRNAALIDRAITFAAILLMQLIIKLLIGLVIRIKSNKTKEPGTADIESEPLTEQLAKSPEDKIG